MTSFHAIQQSEWKGSVTPRDWIVDRQMRRRLIIFVVVIVFGGALLASGQEIGSVLLVLTGLGLAGATIARWVVDGAPLPEIAGLVDGSAPPPIARLADWGRA
jgi:hypothetical protein